MAVEPLHGRGQFDTNLLKLSLQFSESLKSVKRTPEMSQYDSKIMSAVSISQVAN